MKMSEQIAQTRDVLMQRGWHQDWYIAADGRVCFVGALLVACAKEYEVKAKECMSDDYEQRYEIVTHGRNWRPHFVEQFIGEHFPEVNDNIRIWNDAENRTFNDVIDLLDRAELLAKQQEADVA